MNNIPDQEKNNPPDENQANTDSMPKSEADLTPEQKAEQVRLQRISLHQRILSRMVEVGYEGLTDEERAYWNSVY